MNDVVNCVWGAYHDEAYTECDGEFIGAFASPKLCEYIVDLHNKQLEQTNGKKSDGNL